MTIKKFKKLLSDEIIKYPHFYKGETWVFNILTLDRKYDNYSFWCEWMPLNNDNNGNLVKVLSNFLIVDAKKSIALLPE